MIELSILSKILSVRSDGRMTLQQKVARAAGRSRNSAGDVEMEFDSSLQKISDSFFVTLLGASMRVVLDRTGEVVEQEVELPNGTIDPMLKLRITQFLETVVAEVSVILPNRAVSPGDNWDCLKVNQSIPGIGQVLGETKCTLDRVGLEDGETTAIVSMKTALALEPDTNAGVTAELHEEEQPGSMKIAIDRGRIKSINQLTTISIDGKSGNQRFASHQTRFMTLTEVKP